MRLKKGKRKARIWEPNPQLHAKKYVWAKCPASIKTFNGTTNDKSRHLPAACSRTPYRHIHIVLVSILFLSQSLLQHCGEPWLSVWVDKKNWNKGKSTWKQTGFSATAGNSTLHLDNDDVTTQHWQSTLAKSSCLTYAPSDLLSCFCFPQIKFN